MHVLKEIPHGVVFPLKEDHSGRICGKHKTQLSKLTKATSSPIVEPAKEATWSEISSEELVVQDSQESDIPTLAAPRESPKKRGRPQKYSNLERFKMAALAVLGVSLSTTGTAVAVAQATSFEEIKAACGPSRDMVIQALGELYQCCRFDTAEKLSASSFISLMIDATTDSNRELIALHLAGLIEEKHWSRPLGCG
jgi:hypothetical protein